MYKQLIEWNKAGDITFKEVRTVNLMDWPTRRNFSSGSSGTMFPTVSGYSSASTFLAVFSQDGVIKLAPRTGIELDENASPAEKLKAVQQLMEEGDPRAHGLVVLFTVNSHWALLLITNI